MKLILSLSICFFISFYPFNFLLGQQYPSNKKAQNAYLKAAEAVNKKKNTEAIQYLLKTIALDSTFSTGIQQLADIYRAEQRFKEAIPYYRKVIHLSPDLTALTYFGLGESLLAEGLYASALPYLELYAKGNLTAKGALLTNKYILDCKFALDQKLDTSCHLQKLPSQINTVEDEYFPKLTADSRKIIFTRKKDNKENFFESNFTEGWSTAVLLEGEVNSTNFNEGAHSISLAGNYLYFTGCNRPEGLGSCDIYICSLVNGSWGPARNLGAPLNSSSWDAQPVSTADGKTLYFVSNRPGGFGGNDIWKSQRQEDGSWTTPINLGKEINTPFDESAPFIHADNKTLYFVSNGWPGFGQQDVFYSRLQHTNIWSSPQNLGSPINDQYNQNSIQITLDGTIGFLSAQDSSKQLDIYTFNTPSAVKPHPVAYVLGHVYDEGNKKALLAEITVTDINTQEIVFKSQSDNNDGTFIATLPVGSIYAFHLQKPGYLFYSEQYTVNQATSLSKERIKDFYLQPIEAGRSIKMNNLYFTTDSYDISAESNAELAILLHFLNINPTITIEVSGHTDNNGIPAKNKILSENRAKSVQQFLHNKGIDLKRLRTVGYGDKQPVADNATTEGKKLNRRTEIKIVK